MLALHTHDFFELEFLVAGERFFFTKTQMYKMRAPTLLVLPPHTTHKFVSNGCEVYTLRLSPESLSEDQLSFLNFLAKKGILHFSMQKLSPLRSMFESMLKIYNSLPFNNYKKMTFNIHLGRLLYMFYVYANIQNEETHYSLSTDISPSTAPIILKVLDYLHNHFKEDFSLDDLCERFHVSKSYLSSSFACLV